MVSEPTKNKSTWAGNDESRQKVVEAAIKCFKEYGPQKTSMTTIADVAGISRKTVYRVFEDRPTLIEYILVQRINVLGIKVRKRLSQFEDFEEAIVEGSIYSVSVGRRDEITHEIIRHETNRRMEQFLLRGDEEVFAGMCRNWFPIIEKGREQGLVREELSNERIVEIIMSMHALLTMRDDDSKSEQRAFLRDVLLPAITRR